MKPIFFLRHSCIATLLAGSTKTAGLVTGTAPEEEPRLRGYSEIVRVVPSASPT